MAAPKTIIDLVETFKKNEHIYTNGDLFDEENTKTDFINPFFEALGWDVTNKKHRSPQFKDVVYEKSIKVGNKTKAPDYEFRVGGTPIFFVEAKKPSVNLETDKSPAFQVRRYGWSAKLKLCILTDFEELAVYETTTKPDKKQSASIGRVKYYHYSEYIEKWDEIASIFSKEAVLNGDFDNFADSNSDKKKRGTGEVDDEFLKEMEHWRDLLARNIALRNKDLNEDSLNYAVQITIDRILFCRMAEDRGIEKYGTLLELTKKDNIYQHLMEIFRIADLKYNSGLFCLSADPDRHINRDMVTEHLTIDDGVFKEIFTGLYYPNSPYEFSVISPEILGQVYEQLLGSIIRLTPSHMAKVEVKPEVKKAGGVFYTPQYIVKYIIKNTLGKLLQDKTPNQVSKLKILDPACGSGSFLLVAYQELLNYHLDYYTKLEKPPKNVIYQGKDGEWRLTITEKKRILRNNIYGVDLDFLAVEVTKLSLLLKVLEDQNKDVVEQQQKLFHERVLPDLSNNIKNGNSLASSDILEKDLSDDEIKSINPFDWDDEFESVFENGGFDAIVGNPPYIKMQILRSIYPKSSDYYKEKYETSSKGNYDIYVLFVEKALQLLNDEGKMGYILPHKFFTASYGKPLRKIIAENKNLYKIVHFGDQQVFDNATTYTALLFLNKKINKTFEYDRISDLEQFKNGHYVEEDNILDFSRVTSDEWVFVSGDEEKVFYKLYDMPLKIVDYTTLSVGLQTSADKVYIMPLIEKSEKTSKVESKELKENFIIENDILKPLLKGNEIKRYEYPVNNNVLIYPYNFDSNEIIPLTRKELSQFDLCNEYLKLNRDKLINRNGVDSYKWWVFGRTQNLAIMPKPKILYQVLSQKGSFTLDEKGEFYFVGGGNAGGYAITTKNNNICELKYLLGILNSKLTSFFISKVGSCFRGGYYSFGKHSFEKFPLPSEKLENEELENLVDKMINLNKELSEAIVPRDKKLLKKQIEITDNLINHLVYELYGLTDEEIKIIEESIK